MAENKKGRAKGGGNLAVQTLMAELVAAFSVAKNFATSFLPQYFAASGGNWYRHATKYGATGSADGGQYIRGMGVFLQYRMKELEDLPWFPAILRRFQLQYIGSLVRWLHMYRPLLPQLLQLWEAGKPRQLQDLCSGGGQPVIYCRQALPQLPPWMLTDKFPDTDFVNQPGLQYQQESADLLLLQPQTDTCYTLFNGFHHFTTAQQQSLVRKMVEQRSPFLIAEVLEPGPVPLISVLLSSTIIQVLTAPFVRPFSWKRLLFTWILPVNLFTVTYDGIVSVCKSKTVKTYRLQLEPLGRAGYAVTVGSYRNWKGKVIYIKGIPPS